MTTKWNYFLAAGILAGFLLLRAGVPLLPVAAGIGGAALWTWLRRPRTS